MDEYSILDTLPAIISILLNLFLGVFVLAKNHGENRCLQRIWKRHNFYGDIALLIRRNPFSLRKRVFKAR
jgi:hypothetical protein